MNARWLIAKYMDDVRRREPRNVGVLLFTDAGVYAKFRAEDENGDIDGRKLRSIVESVENYKAWVAYWRRTALDRDPVRMVKTDQRQNYFLEGGGERLLGNEAIDPKLFLDRLFHDLVLPTDEATIPTEIVEPRIVIERAFERLNIIARIESRPRVIAHHLGVDDPLAFDYRYRNGINALMKRIDIRRDPWEHVHAAAWAFNQARQVEAGCRIVSLVHCAAGVDAEKSLTLLRKVGDDVVDISDEDLATGGLTTALGLEIHSVPRTPS